MVGVRIAIISHIFKVLDNRSNIISKNIIYTCPDKQRQIFCLVYHANHDFKAMGFEFSF